MNAIPSPSSPPPLVRQSMAISAMRSRGLPRYSVDEINRLRSLIRGRSDSPRPVRCAPRCWTITPAGVLEGGR